MGLSWSTDTDGTGASQAPVDTASLIDRFDGDVDMLSQLSEVFVQEYPQQLSAIRDAFQQQDAVALARSSHMLKGSVGVFGADQALEMARQLEEAGRVADLSGSEQICARLDHEVTRLGQVLADAFLAPAA